MDVTEAGVPGFGAWFVHEDDSFWVHSPFTPQISSGLRAEWNIGSTGVDGFSNSMGLEV
jgi:hypothetical protein